ncbi:MAG: NAD(P)/FAD-dependent oxidoreductase [bacterium]|nr:NAD(P)/FAD-dependent oxidoreductase [bacterium]
MGKTIAVIGGGVSGIAAANILQKNGHTVTVYEKNHQIGGVWAVAYPDVRLQNTWHQYELADFPWTFKPDLHPTATQILRYLTDAVKQLNLDVRTNHDVIAMQEQANGWQLEIRHADAVEKTIFDYVVIAGGQYTEGKYFPQLPNQDQFKGQVLTERDIKDFELLRGKRLAVVGFGKSALDMATFGAEHGAEVHHIFRTPRWTIPPKVLGIHYSYPLFARVSSVMMTSWAHPSAMERFLHKRFGFVVNGFWRMLSLIFGLQISARGIGKGAEVRQRLRMVKPTHALLPDLRSAIALAPKRYYDYVAEGKIIPHHTTVAGFAEQGIKFSDNDVLACDIVILSLGSKTPTFPYMPATYRAMLENEDDGVQLYRHLIHPHIPNVAFAGANHGFMHIPTVEIATIWLCALLGGHIQLPSTEAMEMSIQHIRQWKRDHIHYEPSRGMAVSTRFQQYLDILLKDLHLSPYRKGLNVFGEVFMRYGAKDYRKVLAEYQKRIADHPNLTLLPLDT